MRSYRLLLDKIGPSAGTRMGAIAGTKTRAVTRSYKIDRRWLMQHRLTDRFVTHCYCTSGQRSTLWSLWSVISVVCGLFLSAWSVSVVCSVVCYFPETEPQTVNATEN